MEGPASAIGVVSGIATLAINCVQLYNVAVAAVQQAKDFATFAVFLEIERVHFINWKEKSMINDRVLVPADPSLEDLVMAILDQIELAFNEANKLSSHYENRKPEAWDRRRQELLSIKKVSSFRKVMWAIDDAKAAAKLLGKLQSFNQALEKLARMGLNAVERQLLPEISGIEDVDGLMKLETALKREENAHYQRLANAIRQRRLYILSNQKFLRLVNNPEPESRSGQGINLELQKDNFPADFFNGPLHRRGQVNGQSAIIEWKSHPPSQIQRDPRKYQRVIWASCEQLARLLSHENKDSRLRTLDCIGYYEVYDALHPRACFAFRPPSGTSAESVSLQQFIEDSNRDVQTGKLLFDLGDRFTLAQALANTIYQFQYVGWLHKGIRSSNILFFTGDGWTTEQDRTIIPTRFYLTGCEYARPVAEKTLSLKPELADNTRLYYHPQYLVASGESEQTEYKPVYDLYSLGIVLIEIALWKTMERIAGEMRNPSQQPWNDEQLKYLISQVRIKVGGEYAKSVERCLKGDFELQGEDGSMALLKKFDQLVVARLEKCFA